MNGKQKQKFNEERYDRIYLMFPKGMKDIVKTLASERGISVNRYLQDLIRKDQAGMFDTMQIADRNREFISGISGNMHDGYDIIFTDGTKTHRRTKKDVRDAIIRHCKKLSEG